MNYQQNQKYFANPGTKIVYLAISGVLLLLIGIVNVASDPGTGILFIILGLACIALIYLLFIRGMLKDSDIDTICTNQIQIIKEHAVNKMGIDEDEVSEVEPLIISGYNIIDDNPEILYKVGKDGKTRSSQYFVAVFFFSRDQLYFFERKFSLIKDDSKDSSYEYYYKDIVSINEEQMQKEISFNLSPIDKIMNKPDKKTIKREYFKITTSAGTSFSYTYKKADSENVHRAINAMRNLIKEKK